MSDGREQLLPRTGSLTTYYEDEKRVPFLLRFLNILWNATIFYGIERTCNSRQSIALDFLILG
jgi:hypothetical protein